MLHPATAVAAPCANPTRGEGSLVYNSSTQQFQYCDGTDWIAATKPGSGSGGCNNPARGEGVIVYNPSEYVLQGCAGNQWMPMGPVGGASTNYWTSMSLGSDHACATMTNGALYCWGYDAMWQLGDGATKTDMQIPTRESTAATNWAEVSAGSVYSCGIKADGRLYCWGGDFWNMGGSYMAQGGTGWSGKSLPTQEVTAATNWAHLSTGSEHGCAIKTDGTLYCWGHNGGGQLGCGACGAAIGTPTQVGADADWQQVSAGHGSTADSHTCAVKTGGTLWCWGGDTDGKLGCSACGNQSSPVQIGSDTNWKQVAAAASRTCAVKTNGELYCWGFDDNYQGRRLGCGACGHQNAPYRIGTDTDWDQVSAKYEHSCAVKTNGELYCWGIDHADSLGNGPVEGSKSTPFREQTLATNWASVEVGSNFTCALKTDKSRWCWGEDIFGKLGNGGAAGNSSTPLQEVTASTDWDSVQSMSSDNSCAIKNNGTLWCWGRDGDYDYLGCGGCGQQDTPIQIGVATDWKQVSSGGNYAGTTCGVKTGGTLWCWGSDYQDLLGLGPGTTHQSSPTQVGADTNWKQVHVSNFNVCATKTNGTLYCWGQDFAGSLGNGPGEGDKSSPFQVGTDTDWNQVSTTDEYWGAVCATKTNGTLWCWGSDSYTNLPCAGCGTDQQSPVQVGTDTNWREISVGARGACVTKTNGTLWCWGSDSAGMGGNGSGEGAKTAPFQVGTATNWDKVSLAGYTACGLRTNGDLYCWGEGSNGQMGNSQLNDQQSPVLVGTSWKDVAVNGRATNGAHVCAVNTNDEVYCWGDNLYNQLGAGLPSSNVPLPAGICTGDFAPGKIIYNSPYNVMQYCDGNGWVTMGDKP